MKSVLTFLLAAGALSAAPRLMTVPAAVALNGAKASQQFLAIAFYSDGTERDVTGEVVWKVSNPAIAAVSSPLS